MPEKRNIPGQLPEKWLGRPYYSLDAYCRQTFGEKLCKIALNAGFTCPNRDGTLDTRGCIFCSVGGSGDFAVDVKSMPSAGIGAQLEQGRRLFGREHACGHYIAYFQAYTNTYAPPSRLRQLYEEALMSDEVRGISIATRPDCITDDVLTVLVNVKKEHPDKFVWIELGLQTIHRETARFIRRGYDLSCFDTAVNALHSIRVPIIAHVIIGLPKERGGKTQLVMETEAELLETIDYLGKSGVWGVKLQLLHILRGTDLGILYQEGRVPLLSKEAYLDMLIHALEHLSPETVIHRLTGDGPKELLYAPLWSLNKRDVLNSLHHEMKIRQTFQGRFYSG